MNTQEKIESHEKMISMYEYEMRCNSGKSITKGNYLMGQINYHKRQIDQLQLLLNNEQSAQESDTTEAQSVDEPLLPNNRQQTLKSAKNLKS